jgi:hypothetical protein
VAQHLEGFVGEVDRVALVDEDVVGDSSAHQRDDSFRRSSGRRRRRQGSFRRVTVAGVDETPVPRGEPFWRDRRRQRWEREPGRVAAGVA